MVYIGNVKGLEEVEKMSWKTMNFALLTEIIKIWAIVVDRPYQ